MKIMKLKASIKSKKMEPALSEYDASLEIGAYTTLCFQPKYRYAVMMAHL